MVEPTQHVVTGAIPENASPNFLSQLKKMGLKILHCGYGSTRIAFTHPAGPEIATQIFEDICKLGDSAKTWQISFMNSKASMINISTHGMELIIH